MISTMHSHRLPLAALVLMCGLPFSCISPLRAQDAWTRPADSEMPTEEFVVPPDFDWSQLAADPTPLFKKPVKPAQKSGASFSPEMSWKRDDKADGSSAVAVKQPITPFLDTRIGADMSVATQMPTTTAEVLAQKSAHDNQLAQSGGSAWAAMTAPGVANIWDKTNIEARMDPTQDQSKFGTSLEKTLPIGSEYALTLQNGYRVTQQSLAPAIGPAGHATRNYEVDQSAKLSLSKTGTSLIAGQTMSTAEEKWLRKVGAEQKLFDGVTISGSIGETPSGAASKSLSAGFKRSW